MVMSKNVITKSVIVNFLNESIGLSKRDLLNFFENFIDTISKELSKQQNVKIVNFGVFTVNKRNQELVETQKQRRSYDF